MTDKMCEIELTKSEMERVALIIGYNIDCNLTPERDRRIARKDMDGALRLEKQIQADRALMFKFLAL